MRFSVCKAGDLRKSVEMEVYKEELFKREFEKAMKEGHICGVTLKKAKRFRSAFTTEQINYLEKEFQKYPYVGNARRKDVATILNIPERAVKIWFQNRRMKEKKDTPNKEPDSGKATAINKALKMRQDPSTNDYNESLPMHTSQVIPIIAGIEAKSFTEDKSGVSKSGTLDSNSLSSDANCKSQCVTEPKLYSNPSMINNLATTASDFVYKLKVEKKDEEPKIRAAESTVEDQLRQASLSYVTHKDLSYSQYPSSSSVPEDLSSKTNQRSSSSQQAPEAMFNTDLPVYLNRFYAHPYLPPSNVLWRPVDVAPIVPAPVSVVHSPGPSQPIIRRYCTCDCHKPYPTPLLLQNNPDSNVQYVVTAIPYPNSSPKL